MTANPYTLYSNSFNSAGERVRIALALKGIEYNYVSIQDIGWDRYREEINPQGILPSLVVGDTIVVQSTAILEFLEEVHPQPALLPSEPLLRAAARAFGQVVASEMHAIDVMRVRQQLTDLGVEEDSLEDWSNHWAHDGFRTLQALLDRRAVDWPYCFGTEPGWADLFLIPQYRKAVTRFNTDMSAYPTIVSIAERCNELDAFIQASPEQQSDFQGLLPTNWQRS